MAEGAALAVEVVCSAAPREVWCWRGPVPAGSTAAQAVAASGLLDVHPALAAQTLVLGVWGRRCEADAPLRDGDRVEVYRPLKVDPKEARRLRHRRQRAVTTG